VESNRLLGGGERARHVTDLGPGPSQVVEEERIARLAASLLQLVERHGRQTLLPRLRREPGALREHSGGGKRQEGGEQDQAAGGRPQRARVLHEVGAPDRRGRYQYTGSPEAIVPS